MTQAATMNPRSAPFRFKVAGMDCANCARTIEQGVNELDGVETARVHFATEVLEGRGHADFEALRARVAALGYELSESSTEVDGPEPTLHGLRGFIGFVYGQKDARRAAIFGLLVLASLPLAALVPATQPFITGLHWLTIAIIGWPIAHRAVQSLRFARRITIDSLMTAATLGAVMIGASGEAVAVVLLFTLGEALEAYSAARSRSSLKGLLGLQPDTATVLRRHVTPEGIEQTHYEQIAVAALTAGDIVQVKTGERIPCDGRIIEGGSEIDESAITGESMPVAKTHDDAVFAATINGSGSLLIEVGCSADDFTIARIARLVEAAQNARSPAERFVDRFAQWYTPAVVLLACGVATVPPLLFGQPFLSPAAGSPGWLYRGLALLIVACPCALIVSIPVTVVSALTRLATLGVLVKGGAQLSALANASVFAFDKTGTLTLGRPVVTGTWSRDCAHVDASTNACEPCDELVALAASVERGSSHPLAQAVMEAATHRDLQHRHALATDIQAHAGRGVTGKLGQRRVTVGHETLFDAAQLPAMPQDGSPNSVMLVGDDDAVVGYIRVDDTLRDNSAAALQALKDIDADYRFVMLSGDRPDVADAVARKLALIDEVRAALLPEQKLAAVRELEARYGAVAMVGDGINDAPALAGARLGVAMGGAGTHQAMETADVVLMDDDLGGLARAVAIARKTERIVRENIALSLVLKLAFLALAIPGLATLWMAVLADVGATVLVTLNGMRMLRAR